MNMSEEKLFAENIFVLYYLGIGLIAHSVECQALIF